jgi:hypothetical protein
MQRRQFMLAGAALSGAALAVGTPALAAPKAAASAVTGPRQAVYQALLGHTFLVFERQRGVVLELISVRSDPSGPGLEQFTLTFAGAGVSIGSGTYEIEHAGLGRFSLYLEASGQSARRTTYRAHFSLLA